MAFGKLSSDAEGQPVSEINMIPMIDVMLVLLIVFMITAPLMTNAVKVELPQASSSVNQPDPKDVTLTLNASGQAFWNGEALTDDQLTAHLQTASALDPQPQLQLHADRRLDYGRVADVMARASQLGLHKLAFVSEPTR